MYLHSLHMILTTTSTRTDKSSSSQERLISLSPNLIFRHAATDRNVAILNSDPFTNCLNPIDPSPAPLTVITIIVAIERLSGNLVSVIAGWTVL